ncbi:hypothetical protein APE02nite_05220 [Alkalibacterium pelagium]|uniref:NADPH-dependent FMN reductase n=1 Tax=Alkalibacterium pelagium TaxID=426702 RepID=A0A1H7GCA8_9LACT|nr:hypothetical protein APE02nite_05220 [Alkalibacterium pelagium]SEK35097.1 NADPH-dependent FMN reductase [Alkalibacterium pelagium]
MKIGVVTGSIRPNRVNKGVADWVLTIAEEYGGVDYGLIDIKSFDLPLFEKPVAPA